MIRSIMHSHYLLIAIFASCLILFHSDLRGQEQPEADPPKPAQTEDNKQELANEQSANDQNPSPVEKPDDESTNEEPEEINETSQSDDKKQAKATEAETSGDSEENEADDKPFFKNGSFEIQTDGNPESWVFPQRLLDDGFKFSLDEENALDGDVSALVDTTEADLSQRRFGLLNQYPDVSQLKGKRVCFRAAVRTDELAENGRAQLWLRVDRKPENGKAVMGAFDNMGERPIMSKDWNHYEIVANIEEDAERLTVGMLVIGKAKAWMDDASLEIVDETIETTTMEVGGGSISANAPRQPFFVGWLWLVLITLILFAISQSKNSFVQRFALRFSIGYWILYCFPTLIAGITGSILKALSKFGVSVETATERLTKFVALENYWSETVVHWTAANVFGIEGKLILPNGSGDTTFAYIRVLICFVGALLIAIAWSAVYWRKVDQVWMRDMLRTYLRYVLALTMLGYGLGKAGFIDTQFASGGVPNEFQLNRMYGESSPMGLLWTFMAASPAYTFFAGLCEVIGGLLLVFRRTTSLGALVVIGLMSNVVMLNFCYDVPVKQYSFHLLIMAVFLLLPELPRLANVLFWNRPTEPSDLLKPPYTNSITIWLHRAVKIAVVTVVFAWPVYDHVKKEIEHEHLKVDESEHLLINRGFRWINEYPFNR